MTAVRVRGVPRRILRMSLRARLILISVTLAGAGLAISNALVIGVLHGQLTERLDGQLAPLAAVVSRLPPVPGPVPGSATAPVKGLMTRSDLLGDLHVTYLNAAGAVEQGPRRSPREAVSGPRLPRLDRAAVAARGGRPFEAEDRRGGSSWRVFALPHDAPGASGGTVAVAVSLEERDAIIDRLSVGCLLIGCAVVAGLAGIGWLAVHAGLRPLRRIDHTAAAIAAGDLSRRVPDLAAPDTEVGRLSTALNGMLAQIERAFAARAESEARMRRFMADAGHELRTPLFGIKGFTELYRMGGLPRPADVDATMDRIEREATRLAGLVEDLLLLARLDEPPAEDGDALPLQRTPMDLRTLAADALHDLRALDPSRPVRLTGPGGGAPAGAPVLGDETRLRQVVANLIGNAVHHTPSGTPVRIGVGTEHANGDAGGGGAAVLEIEDAGPGLAEDEAARIFDRFYRVDGSRSRAEGGGAGLGLAIVRSLVARHEGRVELRTAPGDGATFRIVLPVHTDPVP
ncbi:HAMP domain-containing sensor histidine kinase [Actinomadura viridis]|uniref:histidine kinase n=1 Tax=Actinomadura viridis TaxID=58110 RepID=A0A931DCM6_9ACTN|nr:HAMP domain-containing sensor histidine kinase [Actinomadura viridis]MBG6086409.1 two-component system OmpR family sensor kinase [Actinomadura viridis]